MRVYDILEIPSQTETYVREEGGREPATRVNRQDAVDPSTRFGCCHVVVEVRRVYGASGVVKEIIHSLGLQQTFDRAV